MQSFYINEIANQRDLRAYTSCCMDQRLVKAYPNLNRDPTKGGRHELKACGVIVRGFIFYDLEYDHDWWRFESLTKNYKLYLYRLYKIRVGYLNRLLFIIILYYYSILITLLFNFFEIIAIL